MPTAREQLRVWIREHVEGRESLHISDVANEAYAYLQGEEDMFKEFLEVTVKPAVYSEARAVVAETRQVKGDWAPTVKEQRRKTTIFKSRFRGFMQETQDGHVDVVRMNRLQLREAGDIRLHEGRTNTVLGRTFHELANRLPDDVKVVEDVLTDEQVESVYQASEEGTNEV